MEITNIKRVYIVGIEGAGTSALAQLYKNLGYQVSGSDEGDHFYADVLKKANIAVNHGFKKENLPEDTDFVVHSTAFKIDNPEITQALEKNIKIISYPEALGEIFNEKVGIAVCGTHGKTTVTSMLAECLKQSGADPMALVGVKEVYGWRGNVLLGKGEYFVAEADEYQNKLKYYQPWSVVLTSVDWDHPDFFPTFAEYKEVFKSFVAKIPKTGFLVVWGDSSDTLEVAKSANCNVRTYGFGEDNMYKVISHQPSATGQKFEVEFEGESLGEFETPLSGKHNVLNATSVIALAHAMKLDLEKIKDALKNFKGTSRRFENIGTYNDAILIDDYAHHPDEIKATLAGARERFEGKAIWTVFHPHTFSRTKALLEDFAQSFDDAEHVVVIDTYGSARENIGEVTSEDLVKLINKYQHDKAEYVPTIDEAVQYFKEKSGQYDVLITMGAGDVWRVAEALKGA